MTEDLEEDIERGREFNNLKQQLSHEQSQCSGNNAPRKVLPGDQQVSVQTPTDNYNFHLELRRSQSFEDMNVNKEDP